MVAVGRLMLDNFPHVKAYWIMMTPRVAQAGLHFGADDLDGTVITEEIYHRAGSTSPQMIRRDRLVALIREAGRVPVERDSLYNPIATFEERSGGPGVLPPSPPGSTAGIGATG